MGAVTVDKQIRAGGPAAGASFINQGPACQGQLRRAQLEQGSWISLDLLAIAFDFARQCCHCKSTCELRLNLNVIPKPVSFI
jgi:hypothetical protein